MLCFPSAEVSYVEKLLDFLTNLFKIEIYSQIYASEESLSIRSHGEITSDIQGEGFLNCKNFSPGIQCEVSIKQKQIEYWALRILHQHNAVTTNKILVA